MKLSLNVIIQLLMVILQVYNQIGEMLPDEWKHIATFVMTLIQAIVALLAHYKNPDGTPVTLAYVKPVKKIDV